MLCMTVLIVLTVMDLRIHLQGAFFYHYTKLNTEKGLN